MKVVYLVNSGDQWEGTHVIGAFETDYSARECAVAECGRLKRQFAPRHLLVWNEREGMQELPRFVDGTLGQLVFVSRVEVKP